MESLSGKKLPAMTAPDGGVPKVRGVALLLFLPAALGELLSGNAPPLRFFNPAWLLIFVDTCPRILLEHVSS